MSEETIETEVPDWIFDIQEVPADCLKSDINKNLLTFTEEKVVKRIYALGRTLSQVFQQFNFHYWTSGGTTLGTIRHRGLIPWDDDLDLCILQEHEPKFINVIAPYLQEFHNIRVVPVNSVGYRIFHQNESEDITENTQLINYKYPFCDVFVMAKIKTKVKIADARGRTIWPKEKYQYQDIENPVFRKFADFQFLTPNNPEAYLDATYGYDWNIVGETQNYSHIFRESLNAVKFDMISYEPAKPFK